MLFGSDDIWYATLEIIITQTNVRNKKNMSENYSDKFWKLEDNIDKNNWKDKAGFYMIKITLLKTLFYELDPEKIEIVELNHYKERIFHRIEKSFDSIP